MNMNINIQGLIFISFPLYFEILDLKKSLHALSSSLGASICWLGRRKLDTVTSTTLSSKQPAQAAYIQVDRCVCVYNTYICIYVIYTVLHISGELIWFGGEKLYLLYLKLNIIAYLFSFYDYMTGIMLPNKITFVYTFRTL